MNAMIAIPVAKAKKNTRKKSGLALAMERVLEECDRAAVDLAGDPVHDLRVALRRCRSLADGLMALDPASEWKQMKRAGRVLFASLGELRDVQVMEQWTERLGSAEDPVRFALLQSLRNREVPLKLEAAKALQGFDRKQWRRWSALLPGRAIRFRPGSPLFKHLALEHWTNAYALHRRAMRNRSQVALHSLRIGLKRFRYIVENFLPEEHAAWKGDLKQLQDLLGEVHDLDVLWSALLRLNAFPNEQARVRWQARVREERSRRIDQYRGKMLGGASLWHLWRARLPRGEEIESIALRRLKQWAAFLDPEFQHSQQVSRLALQLYDGLPKPTRRQPSPNEDERVILQIAGLLHGLGRSTKEKKPEKATHRLIAGLKPPLGWNAGTLKIAGAVARYHRGALPRVGQKALLGLTPAERQMVFHLGGMLRLAAALAAGRGPQIGRLEVGQRNDFLVIAVPGYSPRDPAAQAIAGARHLMELVYRRPVMVKSLRVQKTRTARSAES
jgi:exopolyphosphatase/guanosine-5'-triphosphate,3'-diphosphate pyrophosphatase